MKTQSAFVNLRTLQRCERKVCTFRSFIYSLQKATTTRRNSLNQCAKTGDRKKSIKIWQMVVFLLLVQEKIISFSSSICPLPRRRTVYAFKIPHGLHQADSGLVASISDQVVRSRSQRIDALFYSKMSF